MYHTEGPFSNSVEKSWITRVKVALMSANSPAGISSPAITSEESGILSLSSTTNRMMDGLAPPSSSKPGKPISEIANALR